MQEVNGGRSRKKSLAAPVAAKKPRLFGGCRATGDGQPAALSPDGV
jgi:hypothetical protein